MFPILNDQEKLESIEHIVYMQLEIHDLLHNMDLELASYHHCREENLESRSIYALIEKKHFILVYSQFTK